MEQPITDLPNTINSNILLFSVFGFSYAVFVTVSNITDTEPLSWTFA